MKNKGSKGKSNSKNKKKTSATKIGNKTNSKLAKRGLLKKGKKKKEYNDDTNNNTKNVSKEPEKSQAMDSAGEDIPDDDDDMVIDDKDYKYFTSGRDFSFLMDMENRLTGQDSKKKKRKRFQDEEEFENAPRKTFVGVNGEGQRYLLPIKDKGKVIEQVAEIEEVEDDVEKTEEPTTEKTKTELRPLSNVEILLQRRKSLSEMKVKIAAYANAILANPQENWKKLKELRVSLASPDTTVTVHKLILISLMEIFKDTIPDYKIRPLTDMEKGQQFKKDTKSLMEYETEFLNNYKHYIEHLQNAVKRFRNSPLKHLKHLPDNCKQSLFEISLKCLSDLLAAHPHFNYRKDLIQIIVPFMNHKKAELSDYVCKAVQSIFRSDKLGDCTLEIVRAIGKFVKSKDFNNVQPKVLETFLSLRVTEIDKLIAENAPKEDKKNSEQMSRKERKRKKKMKTLENELLETRATEDKSKRLKLQTATVESLFHTYFRVLKSASKSPLLPCVLEGLAKFAHLINIQFFNDLFAVLNNLIDSGDLAYREILHCVQSTFTILSGQGSALNVDPMKFYKHLYTCILQVHAGTSSNNMSIILPCLYIVIMKQKRQLSQQKVLAFMKRLSTMALQQLPNSALSLLAAVKQFLHAHPCSDVLFDDESIGSGVFLPELEEPEYCNAHNTMLWELQLLRRHYSQLVRNYSRHLCHKAPTTGIGLLPVELLRKNPEELFNIDPVIFDNNLPSKPKQSRNKKISRRKFFSEDMAKYVESTLKNVPDVVNFEAVLAKKS